MDPPSPLTTQQTLQLKQQNQKLTQQNLLLNQKVKLLEQQMAKMLLEKSKTQSATKENVAHQKCSHGHHNHDHSGHNHGHNHNHGHGHGHGHGHSHGHRDDSSEEENPSEPASTPVVPPPPKPFLHKIYSSQQEINFRYFRLPLKTIKAWKKDENIELTKNKSCMLHLRQMKLNVAQFLSQTWQEVEWINLPECQIDDEGWRMIIQNAHKSLPDLRVLGIRWNNIKTIKEGDIEQFKQLVNLDLGLQSDENNPLSPESRQVIKKLTEAYPKIKIQ